MTISDSIGWVGGWVPPIRKRARSVRRHIVRLPYKKLGLYVKIRQRFWDFKIFPRNRAFWEKCRISVIFDFFEVCFFPITFLHVVLLISTIKIRCQVQNLFDIFLYGFRGLFNWAVGGVPQKKSQIFLDRNVTW